MTKQTQLLYKLQRMVYVFYTVSRPVDRQETHYPYYNYYTNTLKEALEFKKSRSHIYNMYFKMEKYNPKIHRYYCKK